MVQVDNFERMYNECYENMVEAKVAVKVDEADWLDKKGRIVGSEDMPLVEKQVT
jgi:hypothetical protein